MCLHNTDHKYLVNMLGSVLGRQLQSGRSRPHSCRPWTQEPTGIGRQLRREDEQVRETGWVSTRKVGMCFWKISELFGLSTKIWIASWIAESFKAITFDCIKYSSKWLSGSSPRLVLAQSHPHPYYMKLTRNAWLKNIFFVSPAKAPLYPLLFLPTRRAHTHTHSSTKRNPKSLIVRLKKVESWESSSSICKLRWRHDHFLSYCRVF